jgi:hypothetical protein
MGEFAKLDTDAEREAAEEGAEELAKLVPERSFKGERCSYTA